MLKFLRELFAPYPRLIFVNSNVIDANRLQLVVGNRYQVVCVEPTAGVPHVSSYVVVV